MLTIALPVLAISDANPWFAVEWLPPYAGLLLLVIGLILALFCYLGLVGLSRKVTWLEWWLEIQNRQVTAQPTRSATLAEQ